MGEPLLALWTLKRLFARVQSSVFGQVVFVLESLVAVRALVGTLICGQGHITKLYSDQCKKTVQLTRMFVFVPSNGTFLAECLVAEFTIVNVGAIGKASIRASISLRRFSSGITIPTKQKSKI